MHNEPAPEIVGTTLDGSGFDLAQYKGDWVASTSSHNGVFRANRSIPTCCRSAQHHEQAKDGVQLVSVVFNDDLDKVSDFFAKGRQLAGGHG